jgi:preprotein translocase SecE subunit
VARPTRQQRRARRREQAEAAERDGVAQRARARPAAQPVAEPAAPAGPRRGRFIAECWGELKKVDWPGQRQVLTGSIVVIIACAIVGAYLYAADLVFRPFVERVLLGQ